MAASTACCPSGTVSEPASVRRRRDIRVMAILISSASHSAEELWDPDVCPQTRGTFICFVVTICPLRSLVCWPFSCCESGKEPYN